MCTTAAHPYYGNSAWHGGYYGNGYDNANHYNNGYNSNGYHANNYNHGYNSSGYHANNYSHNTNVSGNTVNVNNANRQNASADRSDASASSRGWGGAEAAAARRPSAALEITDRAGGGGWGRSVGQLSRLGKSRRWRRLGRWRSQLRRRWVPRWWSGGKSGDMSSDIC